MESDAQRGCRRPDWRRSQDGRGCPGQPLRGFAEENLNRTEQESVVLSTARRALRSGDDHWHIQSNGCALARISRAAGSRTAGKVAEGQGRHNKKQQHRGKTTAAC